MAVGKATTYDLTTGLYLDIESMIHILSPFDTPLLGQYGADGRTALATGPCFEKKVEWLDETLLTPRSTTAAGATTGETNLTVASGDQNRFGTGDVLLLTNGEYVRVTGYGSTDVLTMTRAFGGSTAGTITSGTAIVGVGTALAEGSDPENARYVDRNNRYNLTQIFGPHAIQVSGSENVVRKYGIEGTTEFEKQVANRSKEIAVSIEQALLYGVRYEDSTTKIRTMGGLIYWITTNVNSTTTVFTETSLLDAAQTCYDAGGTPDRAVMGSKQKRVASSFTSSGTLQIMRPDTGRGVVVDYFDSDFGRLSLLLDRWCRTADVMVFERDQASVETLRPLVFEMLAKTGDSMKGQIVGEKTMRLRRQSHAYRFSALT